MIAAGAILMGQEQGQWLREWWFEPGMEHANPMANARFRVNSPEVVLHKDFGKRSETFMSGSMNIRVHEDLRALEGAELYAELWGGHPASSRKRVTMNGRSTYSIPESGTSAKHCTHQYPELTLKVTDLLNGYNAVQWSCEQGDSFWGHFIVENASIRAVLRPEHADLQTAGQAGTPRLVYRTAALEDVSMPERSGAMRLYGLSGTPNPFWSRANRKVTAKRETVRLFVVAWDGGAGTVKEPITLHGVPMKVVENGKIDVLCREIEVDPKSLKQGENVVELLSDTERLGIEILRPGPALIVRYRSGQAPKETPQVTLQAGVMHQGQESLKITTARATYVYH